MTTADVAILMGSKNDFAKLQSTVDTLKKFGISHAVRVMSAHRTPEDVVGFVNQAEAQGTKVFICAAGLAAHLAGVVASQTVRPVIGIPVDGGPLNGVDALYSTVQMPGGIPVATVAIGSAGATNAAILAAEILAVANPELFAKLKAFRKENAEKVRKDDAALQAELAAK